MKLDGEGRFLRTLAGTAAGLHGIGPGGRGDAHPHGSGWGSQQHTTHSTCADSGDARRKAGDGRKLVGIDLTGGTNARSTGTDTEQAHLHRLHLHVEGELLRPQEAIHTAGGGSAQAESTTSQEGQLAIDQSLLMHQLLLQLHLRLGKRVEHGRRQASNLRHVVGGRWILLLLLTRSAAGIGDLLLGHYLLDLGLKIESSVAAGSGTAAGRHLQLLGLLHLG
mmetsp:Transcript_13400/g.31762  ORF Transcript_13400/g.31762 Transcript_13400/m.31762 type:complete len:222 (+) Transcript_13400:1007-1672(+)